MRNFFASTTLAPTRPTLNSHDLNTGSIAAGGAIHAGIHRVADAALARSRVQPPRRPKRRVSMAADDRRTRARCVHAAGVRGAGDRAHGTHILGAVAFPRSPTVLASQAWDLHANSGGRFVLGLGSQVKGHNERRFGIPWTPPAPRLRDYVGALRAVWRCWETGEKLDYHGAHYTLTLMTPDFSPEPTGLPMIPVTIAAVGEAMLRVAGQVCDGVRLHPLCSRRYLEEVCLPRVAEGMRLQRARPREHFDVRRRRVRRAPGRTTRRSPPRWKRRARRIAFYGSTRTYLPILSLHGLEELGGQVAHSVGQGTLGRDAARWSPTTSCEPSRHAGRIMNLSRRSRHATAGRPIRSTLHSHRERRRDCNTTCFPTSGAFHLASRVSIPTGRYDPVLKFRLSRCPQNQPTETEGGRHIAAPPSRPNPTNCLPPLRRPRHSAAARAR